jgi:hypothetical protein
MSKVYVFNDFGGPENQQLVDRPAPAGPGELAVKVRAATSTQSTTRSALALGTDLPLPPPWVRRSPASSPPSATAWKASRWAMRSSVRSPRIRAFAQDTIVRATEAVAKPEEISFADAATIPVAAATAYDATHQIELEAGQTLLIPRRRAAASGSWPPRSAGSTSSPSSASPRRPSAKSSSPPGPPSSPPGRAWPTVCARSPPRDWTHRRPGRRGCPAPGRRTGHQPSRIISAADPATATEIGGSALERTSEAMAKITGVIEYGLVDPHVTARYPSNKPARPSSQSRLATPPARPSSSPTAPDAGRPVAPVKQPCATGPLKGVRLASTAATRLDMGHQAAARLLLTGESHLHVPQDGAPDDEGLMRFLWRAASMTEQVRDATEGNSTAAVGSFRIGSGCTARQVSLEGVQAIGGDGDEHHAAWRDARPAPRGHPYRTGPDAHTDIASAEKATPMTTARAALMGIPVTALTTMSPGPRRPRRARRSW